MLIARIGIIMWLGIAVLLSGCSSMKYTLDDGRKVDETLLANIRAFGRGEQSIRPAIIKSAQLHDSDCSTQWELPFAVASSDGLGQDDKVAWVRGLQVDERLTMVGVSPGSGVVLGDKIMTIDGHHNDDAKKMLQILYIVRDDGDPFDIVLATGKTVRVTPVKVCRGHVVLANPATPDMQDYHWLQITQPLQIVTDPLTSDEALWVVLWSQGVSEQGGFRMKAYHYGMRLISTTMTLASVYTGVSGAMAAGQALMAQASQVAATAAASAAASAAEKAAAQALVTQAEQQAAQMVTTSVVTQATRIGESELAKVTADAVINDNSLTGVSWAASTVFDQADQWAFERMIKLGANPLGAFTLEMKLADNGDARNGLVFDPDRLKAIQQLAQTHGYGKQASAILAGTTNNAMTGVATSAALKTASPAEITPAAPVVTVKAAEVGAWKPDAIDAPDDALHVSQPGNAAAASAVP